MARHYLESRILCPECGHILSFLKDNDACPHCGADLSQVKDIHEFNSKLSALITITAGVCFGIALLLRLL